MSANVTKKKKMETKFEKKKKKRNLSFTHNFYSNRKKLFAKCMFRERMPLVKKE